MCVCVLYVSQIMRYATHLRYSILCIFFLNHVDSFAYIYVYVHRFVRMMMVFVVI